jgi:hypothetical protein
MKPWYASLVVIALVLVTLVLPSGQGVQAQQRVPAAPSGAAQEIPAVLLTADVSVHAGPDNQSARLGTLLANTIVPVNGRTPDGKWWQILYPGGPNDVGWFAAVGAQPNSAAATVPTAVQNVVAAPTPNPGASTPTAGLCAYDAAFVGDITLPDFTVVAPGQSLNKVWRLKNSGTCTWDATTVLSYIGGVQMAASPTIPVPWTPVGGTVDLSLAAVAPPGAGSFMTVWQLRNKAGELFGPRMTLVVKVEAPAAPTSAPQQPQYTLGTPSAPYQSPAGTSTYVTPTPTLRPLTIDFWSDDTHLDRDHCSTIHWDVEGAQGVYVKDDNSMHGTTGHGSAQVCPTGGGRTYTLKVIHADGTAEERSIRIEINS